MLLVGLEEVDVDVVRVEALGAQTRQAIERVADRFGGGHEPALGRVGAADHAEQARVVPVAEKFSVDAGLFSTSNRAYGPVEQ